MTWLVLSLCSMAIWLVLLAARGQFWRFREQLSMLPATMPPSGWPHVVAIVPARNEADMLPQTLPTLLNAYSGSLNVIIVDDNSDDGTGNAARDAAQHMQAADRVQVINGQALPQGWTGKLWAIQQGVALATAAKSGTGAQSLSHAPTPDYILLTDADIAYAPKALDALVTRATAEGLVLVSIMARLRCVSVAERFLVPAFVYFFAMLYPFRWVNDPRSATAAAAGGCMLVRPAALMAAGGVASIRGALIDDVTLGTALKRQGPVWLGLSAGVMSLRAYPRMADIADMVARTAYTQLRGSWLLLLFTMVAMTITFLVPPAALILAEGPAQAIGAATFLALVMTFGPILQQYGVSRLWAPLLPMIAACYCAFTVLSFARHLAGHGGRWKGRVHADHPGP